MNAQAQNGENKMDLAMRSEDVAFRDEVRAFLNDNLSDELKAHARLTPGILSDQDLRVEWLRRLNARGWAAPSWPKEFGGAGWNVMQRFIWASECAAAGAPAGSNMGLSMVGPTLMGHGTKEQQAYYLPRILNGEDWWCQGYSEPGSGSDLASLQCRAVLDGDDYVINGTKLWTTGAHQSNKMFCLVRTNPDVKAQEGISFLLIDMKTPGITVRPIITMDGAHEVNEVFLEDVRVPVENRIGEENKGWTYAKFLLGNERSGIAGVARSKKAIERLKKIATAELVDGQPLMKTDEFSRKVAELEIDLSALEVTELRTLAAESKGKGPGPEASILKIKGTEIQQRITELAVEAVGNYGFVETPTGKMVGNDFIAGPDYSNGAAQNYFNVRKTSIYGGSNEIQHNIIAKMVLGL
jgi:alkylation response protein AidB-like acyl-CoA dehydrogenase